MKRISMFMSVAFVVLVSGGWAQAQKPAYNFFTIDPPGSVYTIAMAINAQGDIVGGFRDNDDQYHGFLLSQGSYRVIDVPERQYSFAQGINAYGQIVGEYSDSDGILHGFLLDRGNFVTIDVPGALWTSPQTINDAGDIAGVAGDVEYTDGGPHYGFLLRKGEYTQIELPDVNVCGNYVHSINDAGEVVGDYTIAPCNVSNPEFHGFMLKDDSFTKIDVPNAVGTVPYGINAQGVIVGTYGRAGERGHGFLLWKGVVTDIDFPGSRYTRAFGINTRGWIVGDYGANGVKHGFLAIK